MNGLFELMDYMLAWTLQKCADDAHKISPEVYDRCVSVVGIVVPCGLFLLACACFFLCIYSFWLFFAPRKGGK